MPHVSRRILMRLQRSAQGPYEIRRAANLVVRMPLLGFLHAFSGVHNRPEGSVSFFLWGGVTRSRMLQAVYMERCARKDGDFVGPFARVVI